MSTTNQRSRSKERFWRRMMGQWCRSGLPIRAFCAQQQLSEPSFYFWRRALAHRDAQATPFVPVHIVPDEKPATAPATSSPGLEVVLGTGRVLRISPGFDGPTLRRLLAILEEGLR